jgi:hypothetical protein
MAEAREELAREKELLKQQAEKPVTRS